MFIGSALIERMSSLGICIEKLANDSFIDEAELENIVSNKVELENIDEFTLDMISSVLYCTPEYFSNDKLRSSDIIYSCMNRGESGVDSNVIKARLQRFANDLVFLSGIC